MLKMKNRRVYPDILAFNVIGYIIITLFSVFCLIPFWLVISGSFTDESTIIKHGYSLFPEKISFGAYMVIFKSPQDILQSYGVTVFITVVGTLVSLFIISMTAYVLYRKDCKYRNQIAFFFYFTMLFDGGLVPYYILMVRYLRMKDSILALIIPGIFSVWYTLLMRNFMKSIPDSISESAKIDGAGDFAIFIKIIIHLLKPALASIGLFVALGYWNDWFNAMLYINNTKLYPLQYLLYRMLNSVSFSSTVATRSHIMIKQLPTQTLKLAMTVVATGPIILLYPFVQKYFVKGITIGAVKG